MDSIFIPAQKPPHSCQDYCIVGETKDFKYAILCDGCSSSKDTDIGARLLAHACKQVLNIYSSCDIRGFLHVAKFEIIEKSYDISKSLNLNETCLDATIIISIFKDDKIYYIMFGDGNIIASNKENKVKLFQSISFDQNAPAYLSYFINSERHQVYNSNIKFRKIKSYIDNNGIPIINEREDPIRFPRLLSFVEVDSTKCFFISSDGIESFYNIKTGEKIPSIDIVKELINIKSKHGEFLKRRVRRMMEDLAKKDIYNSDDVSVCGFIIEEKINGDGIQESI